MVDNEAAERTLRVPEAAIGEEMVAPLLGMQFDRIARLLPNGPERFRLTPELTALLGAPTDEEGNAVSGNMHDRTIALDLLDGELDFGLQPRVGEWFEVEQSADRAATCRTTQALSTFRGLRPIIYTCR
jgi:hypothetical protein